MNEQRAIEQLSSYRQKQAILQALSTYSVGAGITVSRLNEDDQLQDLHARLRRMPSYMYLSKHEQKLEQTANAYMTRYPAGIKAQKRAVPVNVMDDEDSELLQELKDKIQKVIAARGYEVRDNIDEILERLAEFQDLQAEVKNMDIALKALEQYKPEYAKLLKLRFIDGIPVLDAAEELHISRKTFDRWRAQAVEEFSKIYTG
ncbi:ECF-type sigma factor [Paenibacillus motobuensis]|uniref:RNA polymerase sigma-70 ECF-like HTH domain-containing protein n=1 Tax=Paenibacillus motobuensis TaxID=295324 RepID=A0ABP3HW73_9BACL